MKHKKILLIALICLIGIGISVLLFSGHRPVSYTHLDVYKRQGWLPLIFPSFGRSCLMTNWSWISQMCIRDRLHTYARKLAENMNQSFAIDARVPSVMIPGPANFPVGKKEKQNRARDSNMEEWRYIQGLSLIHIQMCIRDSSLTDQLFYRNFPMRRLLMLLMLQIHCLLYTSRCV